jgi:hypothetical protein
MNMHDAIVAEICRHQSGIIPLRALMRIEPGMMRRLNQTQALGVARAARFAALGLLVPYDKPSAEGKRTWRYVSPTTRTADYVAICEEASRNANLSWLELDRGTFFGKSYYDWRQEWLERRDAFRRALISLAPQTMPEARPLPEIKDLSDTE